MKEEVNAWVKYIEINIEKGFNKVFFLGVGMFQTTGNN